MSENKRFARKAWMSIEKRHRPPWKTFKLLWKKGIYKIVTKKERENEEKK